MPKILYSKMGINREIDKSIDEITDNLKQSIDDENKFFYRDPKTSKFYQIIIRKEGLNKGRYITAEVKWHAKSKYPHHLDNLFLNQGFGEIGIWTC